jgi:TetR/AcrR family transcriptional regulator, fatty acid metabolism regulator protein
MSPRPNRRAERIPQILEAARAVFARSGFAEARMEDIAEAAGLSKATLYLYFPSKDELIGALLQQYFANAFVDLTALRDAPGALRERLGAWSTRRIAELEADVVYLALGYEFFAVAARQPAVRTVLRDYYRRYRAELTALIAGAATQGEPLSLPPPELATALVAFFEGLTMLWMLDPDSLNLHAVTASALDGLLGKEELK